MNTEEKIKNLLCNKYDIRPSTSDFIMRICSIAADIAKIEYDRGYLEGQATRQNGEWIDEGDPNIYVCSEYGHPDCTYCSNCGAKMEVKNEKTK